MSNDRFHPIVICHLVPICDLLEHGELLCPDALDHVIVHVIGWNELLDEARLHRDLDDALKVI